MPYSLSTNPADELIRRYNETCTFQKSFENNVIARNEIFVSFLRQLNIPYIRLPNHAGISTVEVTCRNCERGYVDTAADIINRGYNEAEAMRGFAQEYTTEFPNENTAIVHHQDNVHHLVSLAEQGLVSPSQIRHLSEEGIL